MNELSENQMLITEQFYDSYLGGIYPDCEVVIKKRALTDGLNNKLKDGDRVGIYLVTPGGG